MKPPITREGPRLAVANNATLALLLAPCIFIAPQHEASIVFAPHAGSSIAKQVDIQLEMRLTRLQLNDYEFHGLDGPTIRLLTSARFADTHARIDGGRPIDYLRHFEDISLKWASDGVREDVFGFHPLSACSLRYRWQPDVQDYSTDLEEGRCRTLLLEGLIEDTDLRGLLPDSVVARGREWTAKGRPLVDALFGPLELAFVGISKENGLECRARDILLRPFLERAEKQAELRCKYVESFEANGSRCAQITLCHADKYSLYITDQVNECLRASDPRLDAYELSVEDFRLDWTVDGHGTLTWNVTEGHYESLDLEAEVELEGSFGLRFGRGQDTWKIRFGARGPCTWAMRATSWP